mmetsp:Transcript_55844/g.141423  ORF Transcript_55844/g.141423 Transcript_55844/m.141423 type:complete len:665 (+) Transcript_55844:108-2102(+)
MRDDELLTAPMMRTSRLSSPHSKRSQKRNKMNHGSAEATHRSGRNHGLYGGRGGAGRGGRSGARGPLARLESELQARLAECALSEEEKACIDRCTSELQSNIEQLGSGWSLKLFGSAANGFGTRNSDIDATCVEEDSSADGAQDAQSAADFLKERVCPVFMEHPQFSIVEEVLGANIPILKLRFEDRLDVDLSYRNVEALQNTRLLRGYADLDHRVRDLGILVKMWARAADVWGASRRFLSSYTFTLLAIYFMQVHPDVQLPYLPTMAFSDSSKSDGQEKVAAARSLWSCSLTMADLVTRFFAFYHFDFQWGREVVSTRLGRRLWANDKIFDQLRGRWASRLHVEDPYKLERNLHCVLGQHKEEAQLRMAFAEAWNTLQMGGTPVGLGGSELLSLAGLPDAIAAEVPAGAEADVEQTSEGAVGRGTGEDSAECTDEAAELDGEGACESLEAAGPKARKKRTESALSSPDSSAASTTSGGLKVGESSGGESQTSDDEKVRALSILTTVPSSSMTAVPSSVDEDIDFDGRSQRMSDGSLAGWMSGLLSVQNAGSAPGEDAKEVDEADNGKWQWWRHLGEINVQSTVGACAANPPQGEVAEKKKNKKNKQPQPQWHNIQDLEGKLGWNAGEKDCATKPMGGLSFASRSTGAIAARVTKLCLGHVAYQ